MPSKIRPSDWDRLFAPKARRRGGLLVALFNTVVVLGFTALLGVGLIYAKQYVDETKAAQEATQTVVAATRAVEETATAVVVNATATAEAMPTPTPLLPVGVVLNGGNLRSEPRIAEETIVGLVFPGDEVVFLDQQEVDGQLWYHIRVTLQADSRGVPVGTEGWASATLLSPPATPAVPPASAGPLGVLEQVTDQESGISLLVPQGWTRDQGLAANQFAWTEPGADQRSRLVGQVFGSDAGGLGGIDLVVTTWIQNTAMAVGGGGTSLPSVQEEMKNPDGSGAGGISIGQFRGRYRTFMSQRGLVGVMLMVPKERFDEAEPVIRQILESAALQ